MVQAALEYAQVKQPINIELYVEKLKEMNGRTIMQYDHRWTCLLKRHSNEFYADKLKAVVDRVVGDARDGLIKPSTYRNYKAAVCYGLAGAYIQVQNDKFSEHELEGGLTLQLLSSLYREITTTHIDFTLINGYQDKTSAYKKKSFPLAFYQYLEHVATTSKATKRFLLMLSFVKANLVVGLRPIEWLNVRLCSAVDSGSLVLLVQNAKNSNGRANGDVREIALDGATAEQNLNVLRFFIAFNEKLSSLVKGFLLDQGDFENKPTFHDMRSGHVFGELFPEYKPSVFRGVPVGDICDKQHVPQQGLADIVIRSLQNEMYLNFNKFKKANPDTSEKRVTLYSTRHQCIANAKASKVSVFEIAAFFGHSSIETNSRHYGKAWSGWSNFTFKPHPNSILAVTGSKDYVMEHYPSFVPVSPSIPTDDSDLYLGVD